MLKKLSFIPRTYMMPASHNTPTCQWQCDGIVAREALSHAPVGSKRDDFNDL